MRKDWSKAATIDTQLEKRHTRYCMRAACMLLHQTNSAESRPHTSQGTRPSTAHGSRQPDRDPPPSPAIPQKQLPTSPLRKPNPPWLLRLRSGTAQELHSPG